MFCSTKRWIITIGAFLTLPFSAIFLTLHQFDDRLWVLRAEQMPFAVPDGPAGNLLGFAILIFLFVGGGCAVSLGYWWMLQKLGSVSKKRYALVAGILLALPVSTFAYNTVGYSDENESLSILIAVIALFCVGWGYLLHRVYPYLLQVAPSPTYDASERLADDSSSRLTRRRFLQTVAATSSLSTLGFFALDQFLIVEKQEELQALEIADLPPILKAKLYPMGQSSPFPEMADTRYSPESHPLGVCFSGGGFRAYSAALGQLRALAHLGLTEQIGAISGVSGGALLSTLFQYAPLEIADETLLGPVLAPEELTWETLGQIHPQNMASPLIHMTDERILEWVIEEEEIMLLTGHIDPDEIYARVLNRLFLEPFGLHHTNKFFTLNQSSVREIVQRNPSLSSDDFYITRPNRPYLIVGASHAYPINTAPTYRHFEFTPLYAGTPQFFAGQGVQGKDFGGGYIESFAFDGKEGSVPDTTNVASVKAPRNPFLLSDMIGSTSAVPGEILNKMGQPDLMPSFYYWPIGNTNQTRSEEYSFIDGLFLENLGVVPLLRRRFPVILVFVNTGFPVGLEGTEPFSTLDFHVGHLFGFTQEGRQDTQIFPQEQFQPLSEGLKKAKRHGKLPLFVDQYEIVQPNPFDIPPYPNDEPVTVVWFYNDLYQPWLDALPAETRSAMSDPQNNLSSFPHYRTIFHNTNGAGIPELFYLSPEQINLLSHMWTHAVIDGAANLLDELRVRHS